ncbi:MAG: RluA family pseudouridine synthase [Spirochaetota bacterium]
MNTQILSPEDILYENNHLIAVNKRCGTLSQDDGSGRVSMPLLVKEYLKHTYNKPGNAFLGIVHRLDFPVSGALLYGKTSKGASRISEQIRRHTFAKYYLVLCDRSGGTFGEWTTLTDYLTRSGDVTVPAAENDTSARKAIMRIRTVDSFGGSSLHLIQLETGRKHQIRAQLAARGMPIAGDVRYGSTVHIPNAILLHCVLLKFLHPTEQSTVIVHAPLKTPFSTYVPDFYTESLRTILSSVTQ